MLGGVEGAQVAAISQVARPPGVLSGCVLPGPQFMATAHIAGPNKVGFNLTLPDGQALRPIFTVQ